MHTSDSVAGLVAELKAQRAAFRQAVAAHDRAVVARWLTNLNDLMARLSTLADSFKTSLTAREFETGCLGATPLPHDPLADEVGTQLIAALTSGLQCAREAAQFRKWCKTGNLSGTVGQIRGAISRHTPGAI